MEKTIDFALKRGELAPMLRGMEIGDMLHFPIEKYNSIRGTIANTLIVERSRLNQQWSVIPDVEAATCTVTRLA